ncbi:uncharacterized protein LOC115694990 [Cannabis sativa]|uniref:uncharacterized protein LOC115694990 n=1 Tax=Cannabis sativa TaxID=3483 RepID=UPI0029CA7612|nr:uncharacterized protein LOC115694990 [Cannabis sativa]
MNVQKVSCKARCQYFVVTLKGAAYKWFKSLRLGTITSWKQFLEEFHQQHQATSDYIVPITSITNVMQGEKESLRRYIQRFNAEVAKVGRMSNDELKFAIAIGICLGSGLWGNMLKRELDGNEDFYEKAEIYIRIEEGNRVLGTDTSECTLASLSDPYKVY